MNFTTGGPLIATLVMVPVIVAAVVTLSAVPVVDDPGDPAAPVAPAGPAGPVVPLQADTIAHRRTALTLATPVRGRRNLGIPLANDIQNSPGRNDPQRRAGLCRSMRSSVRLLSAVGFRLYAIAQSLEARIE